MCWNKERTLADGKQKNIRPFLRIAGDKGVEALSLQYIHILVSYLMKKILACALIV